MTKDFFDDDLNRGTPPDASAEPAEGAGAEAPAGAKPPAGRLAKHRADTAARMSDAARDLEMLHRKKEELERKKAAFESASRKQEEYERGKQDLIEKLDRSLVMIEKEEVHAMQLVEVLTTTRQRFRTALEELNRIDEERWPDDRVAEELNKAHALLEEVREVYKKGLAKIDASRWKEGAGRSEASAYEPIARSPSGREGFGFWLRVGLAVTLPITVVLVLLFVFYLAVAWPLR
jgi:vacuolar-type H+-ATPase subunit I/STV1